MLRRETLAEFDIYGELVARRRQASAEQTGRDSYEKIKHWLVERALEPDEAERIARVEAQQAERHYLTEWHSGQKRQLRGLGVGVRALFLLPLADRLIERFVPDPLELGAPEVVEVEVPGLEVLRAGLILPNGTYHVTTSQPRDRFKATTVYLYPNAQQIGPDYVEPVGNPGAGFAFMPAYLDSISDAGGAHWQPPAPQFRM